MNFFHLWFIITTIAIVFWLWHLLKKRPLKEQNNILERKIEELEIEIKNSANKTLTDDESNDLHKRMGGRQIRK